MNIELEEFGLSLEDILGATPNIVTPNLKDLVVLKNEKKPKKLAEIIVDAKMASIKNPTTKEIAHKGEIHRISYFDIAPMKKGVWCEMSLLLLACSYQEQCQVIEALYPEDLQLIAKAFAATFTVDGAKPIQVKEDEQLHHKLDEANVGIAMLIAMFATNFGNSIAHPDVVNHYLKEMDDIANASKEATKFKHQSRRSEQRYLAQ